MCNPPCRPNCADISRLCPICFEQNDDVIPPALLISGSSPHFPYIEMWGMPCWKMLCLLQNNPANRTRFFQFQWWKWHAWLYLLHFPSHPNDLCSEEQFIVLQSTKLTVCRCSTISYLSTKTTVSVLFPLTFLSWIRAQPTGITVLLVDFGKSQVLFWRVEKFLLFSKLSWPNIGHYVCLGGLHDEDSTTWSSTSFISQTSSHYFVLLRNVSY